MSIAEGFGGSSSPEALALGDVLTFFGAVSDYAAGAPPEHGRHVASLAVALGIQSGLQQADLGALYFAALLRNAGALGNPGFAKGEQLPERAQAMQRWDIPAHGARICERIASLPPATADIVRWQAECWDGTGYPDQLRWSGIPRAAQLLHIAQRFVETPEPEDALASVSRETGRTFSPDESRTFVMWFHTGGGEVTPVDPPFDALDAARTAPMLVIDMLSERIDAHNGTPLRAQRIARRAADIGKELGLDEEDLRRIHLAALLFGIGEIRAPALESAQFDPLARLGIETRASHALAAANLAQTCGFAASAAPALRGRGEWYDGTGAPDRLRHEAIPRAGHVLALAIAFDALEETYRSRITEERTMPVSRLETVSGTQFDPAAVRALAQVVKARA